MAERHLKQFYEKGSIVLREEFDIADHHIQMMDIGTGEVTIYLIFNNEPQKQTLKIKLWKRKNEYQKKYGAHGAFYLQHYSFQYLYWETHLMMQSLISLIMV